MPIPPYVQAMRAHIGHDLLMLSGVSAVIVGDDGEVLLGQRSDNRRWSLIAGTVEPGEQPADAIVREAYEEAGIYIGIDRLAGVALHHSRYPNGDLCHFVNTWFRCHVIDGIARVNDDESIDMRWFPADALPDVSDFVRMRIDIALREQEAAWFAPPGAEIDALADLTSG
ncbi:MAG TPA: NUDIX domain-containing protein [Micromonosporaceae bacterium]